MEIAETVVVAFIVGYMAYYFGKDKGIDEGRLEGRTYGIARGFLEGWISRHSGEEIPEWVTREKPPEWVIIRDGMYSDEEVFKWGAAVNNERELSRLRDEEARQLLNRELRNQQEKNK